MARADAVLNVVVSGSSKIDRLIQKLAQLESIVDSVNQEPLQVNSTAAQASVDEFYTKVKSLEATSKNLSKSIDDTNSSINKQGLALEKINNRIASLNPETKKYNAALEKKKKITDELTKSTESLEAAVLKLAIIENKSLPDARDKEKEAKRVQALSKALEDLRDDYLQVGIAQQRGAQGNALAKQSQQSIAQLNAQAQVLGQIASNSKIGSQQFNKFTIASQVAGQAVYNAQQQQLKALAFGLSGQAPAVSVGIEGEKAIPAARKQVAELIGSYGGIVKSEAAMGAFYTQAKQLQSLVPYLSDEFEALEEILALVDQELAQIGRRGQVSLINPQKGPATNLGTLKAFLQRAKYEKTITDEASKQIALGQRISQAKLNELQKLQLRNNLEQASVALNENRLEDAQRFVRQIDRQRFSLERLNREQLRSTKAATQVFGTLGTGFMPITGELPATINEAGQRVRNFVPGSPGYKQQQERIARGETSAAVSLAQQKMREEEKAIADAWKMRGGPALPPGFTEAGKIKQRGETLPLTAPRVLQNTLRSGELIEKKLINLQGKGVDVTNELKTLQEVLNAAKQKDFVITKNTLDLLVDQVGVAGHFLQLQRAIGAGQRGKGGKGVGPEGTGLEQALERLREARGARLSFFGDASPAEAIDKIVREFNAGATDVKNAAENVTETFASSVSAGSSKAKAAGTEIADGLKDGVKDALGIASPSKFIIHVVDILVKTWIDELGSASPRIQLAAERAFGLSGPQRMTNRFVNTIEGKKILPATNYRALPARGLEATSQGPEMDAMMRRFRKQIAALTTQPAIYENLLNAIPSSRLTTNLAGLANRRMGMAAQYPDYLPGLRRIEARGGPLPRQTPGVDIFDLENEIKKLASSYFKEIRVPNPWIGAIGDYKKFIDSIELETKQLRPQPLLAGTRIAGALPPVAQSIGSVRQQRIEAAYRRSSERGLRVLAADAFAGQGQFALPPASFGFAADPARIRRLMQRGRRGRPALPAGIDAQVAATISAEPQAAVARTESNGLRAAVRNFFNRIRTGVTSAAGGMFGGGGGGTRPPVAGGAPGRDPGDLYARAVAAAQQGPEALLGLEELRQPNLSTINELNALSAVLAEVRANLDPLSADFNRLDAELRDTIASLGRIQERRAPGADFLTRRFDPRMARGMSEGLIGGAFPLLFGQGIGASIGGGLGGFAGGFAGGGLGFGLSLIGTAVGTAVDTFLTNLKSLASGLDDPTTALEALKTAGMGASKQTEKIAKALVESGNAYQAQQLVIAEINSKLGANGVKLLQAYERQQQELDSTFQKLSASITSSVLPALVGFNALVQDTMTILGMGNGSGKSGQSLIAAAVDFGIKFSLAQYVPILGPGPLAGYIALQERGKSEAAKESGRPGMKEDVLLASRLAKYQKDLEAMDIGKSLIDNVRQAAREQKDLDKQRADLVSSYEENIGQIRERVEDEISRRRFSLLETENEILNAQGDNRIKILELQNKKIIAAAGVGQLEEVVNISKKTAEIVGRFTEAQLTAAEEQAKILRDSKIEEKQFDFEAGKFKAGIAKEVARLNLETAKQVQAINEQVARRNEELDTRRFEIEKKIAEIQFSQLSFRAKSELDQMKRLQKEGSTSGVTQRDVQAQSDYLDLINKGMEAVRSQVAPPKLKGIAGVDGLRVSTSGVDKIIADQKAAIDKLLKEKLVGLDLTKEINIQEFQAGMQDVRDEIEKFFNEDKIGFERASEQKMRISKFLRMGYSQELAQKAARIEQEKELLELSYQSSILTLEQSKAKKSPAEIAVIDAEIDKLRTRLGLSREIANSAISRAAQQESPFAEIETQRDLIQEQLNAILKTSNQVISVAGVIGEAFSQSFRGIIDGTMTADQALASFFDSIANHFLDMATQIIAKWIEMTILNSVLQLFPGSPTAPINPGYGGGYIPLPNAYGNAFGANGIIPFAKGGMFTNSIVSSPTLFKFADGAAMRTGVMGEAGSEAIMPLTRGPGGALGVQAYGGGGGDTNITIHVDATGTKVAGDDTNAKELGRVVTAAVQTEIIKQQRPGGLLNR